jgi:hypothetical protein
MYIFIKPNPGKIINYFPFFQESFSQLPTLINDWSKIENTIYANIQKIIEKHNLIDYSHDISFLMNFFRYLNYIKNETEFNQTAIRLDNYARDLQKLFDSLDLVSEESLPFDIKFNKRKWETQDSGLKKEIIHALWDNPIHNKRWKIAFEYVNQKKLRGEMLGFMKKRTGPDPDFAQGSIKMATMGLYHYINNYYPSNIKGKKRQVQILLGELFNSIGIIKYDPKYSDDEEEFYRSTIHNWIDKKISDPFPPVYAIILMDKFINSFFTE